jgi:hypothetical protein
MAVEIVVPEVAGAAAMRIGNEAVALLGALNEGGITLDVAAGLVKAGMAQVLIGQRESDGSTPRSSHTASPRNDISWNSRRTLPPLRMASVG